MSVAAVIFDIGNVLLQWDPVGFYDRVYGPALRRALFEAVDLDSMNLAIDRGAPLGETVAATADRHPDHAAMVRDWHDRWIEMASPEIPGTVAILRGLKAQAVPVHALSNFGKETFVLAQRRYDFLSEFDRAFISGHLGVVKPDPAIYALVEESLGLRPDRLFFTDDRPENIDVARARGWQAHLFDGPEGLERRLASLGLLSGR